MGVTTKFEGIKKKQLEASFQVYMGEKDFYLLNPGMEFDPDLVVDSPTKGSKRKLDTYQANAGQAAGEGRKKQKKEKSDEPPPPLFDDEVEAVRDLLNEHGGQ